MKGSPDPQDSIGCGPAPCRSNSSDYRTLQPVLPRESIFAFFLKNTNNGYADRTITLLIRNLFSIDCYCLSHSVLDIPSYNPKVSILLEIKLLNFNHAFYIGL